MTDQDMTELLATLKEYMRQIKDKELDGQFKLCTWDVRVTTTPVYLLGRYSTHELEYSGNNKYTRHIEFDDFVTDWLLSHTDVIRTY